MDIWTGLDENSNVLCELARQLVASMSLGRYRISDADTFGMY